MSNQNPKLNLEFNIEDIPWLFHTLSLQTATTMCYGRVADRTKERVKQYIDRLKEFSPVLVSRDIEEYAFFNAVGKLYDCKTWSLYQEKPRYKYELKERLWKPVLLVCDNKTYKLTSNLYYYNESLVLGLIDLFKQMTPLDSEYIEHESIQRELLENPSWYTEKKG